MSLRRLTVPALLFAALLLAGCSSTASSATETATAAVSSTAPAESTASAAILASPTSTTTTEQPPASPADADATPPPEPEPADILLVEPANDLADLEQTLTALAAAYWGPGEFAFAVTDIQTGETVGVNVDRPHLTGCTVNFFVLLQATLDVQSGLIDEAAVGDLISTTIRGSSAATAYELYGIVGDGDVVAGVERVAGLVNELAGEAGILDHPPLYGEASLGVNDNNWITATAVNEALRATYADGVLEDEWRDYLLAKMTEVKDGLNYLLAVGPDVKVSHKNGFFPTIEGQWVDNDIGIVRFEQDGEKRAYAVSFFSQRVPEKYGDVYLGQQLSTATWKFFQERYPSSELLAAAETNEADSGS
jgi:hypothetical protein